MLPNSRKQGCRGQGSSTAVLLEVGSSRDKAPKEVLAFISCSGGRQGAEAQRRTLKPGSRPLVARCHHPLIPSWLGKWGRLESWQAYNSHIWKTRSGSFGIVDIFHVMSQPDTQTPKRQSSQELPQSSVGLLLCAEARGKQPTDRPSRRALCCEGFPLGILFDSHKLWSVKFLRSMKAKLKVLWSPVKTTESGGSSGKVYLA